MKALLWTAFTFAWAASSAWAQSTQSPSATAQNDSSDKKTAKLQGQVVNQVTGEPVRKVNLTLKPQPDGTAIAAVSDAEGKFSIDNIDPGRYTLTAERQGFVQQAYGAKRVNGAGITLDLRASQVMKDLSFKLMPQGVIAGHVLDDEGEPVAGVTLMALQYRYLMNKKRLMPVSGGQPASTNDLGEFRISNLAPGRYYIASASQKMGGVQAGPERDDSKGPEEALVPTYFPSAADADSASQVDVGPGAEVRGIDIRLRKTRVFHVRGKVVDDATGSPLSPASLIVYRREATGGMSLLPTSTSFVPDTKGSFELKNIPSGSYAMLIVSPNPMQIKMVAFDIADQDVDNFTAHFGAGVDVPVTAKVADVPAASASQSNGQTGASPPADLGNIRVGLIADDILINPPSTVLGKDSKATLKGVFLDRYRVYAAGLPDGAYLKAATFGDQDVLTSELDLRQGATGTLQLTIGLAAAQLSVTVHNDKGEPVQGAHVTVIAKDSKGRIDLARAGQTDQNGVAQVHGIVPGEYNVFAWEDIEPGAAADEDYLKPFLSLGTPVKVAPSEKQSLQLTLITHEAMDQINSKR
jgi:protocatechuate 3,4-dioxygenase beta subunit